MGTYIRFGSSYRQKCLAPAAPCGASIQRRDIRNSEFSGKFGILQPWSGNEGRKEDSCRSALSSPVPDTVPGLQSFRPMNRALECCWRVAPWEWGAAKGRVMRRVAARVLTASVSNPAGVEKRRSQPLGGGRRDVAIPREHRVAEGGVSQLEEGVAGGAEVTVGHVGEGLFGEDKVLGKGREHVGEALELGALVLGGQAIKGAPVILIVLAAA
jgi:hypothetical protein